MPNSPDEPTIASPEPFGSESGDIAGPVVPVAPQESSPFLATEEIIRALAASEERYALAVRGSNDGIWDWDLSSGMVEYSPRFKELLGYRDHEMANLFVEFSSKLHPEDESATTAAINAHLAQGTPYDVEYRLMHRDGSYRWFRARGLAVRNAEGAPTRMAGSITDVTDRKAAEEKLNLISNRLILATQAGAIGIWDFDTVANTLVWDEQMYRLYGITEDSFSGAYEAWEQGLHPEDLTREREKIQRALRGEGDFDSEFRVLWPDHTIHYIKANGIVQRDASGRPLRMIGTNWDITQRRKAEDDLRIAKRNAEAGARAKSEFLANMSHEIRTPMNGIIGMAELLSDTKLSPTQREYLSIVRNSADSLLSILNDILDFSKIEAGRMTLDRHPFHLRDSVGDTLQALSVRAADKQLELAYRIEPEAPDYLRGDSGRLQQILNNLVGNAIKFTQTGEVVVTVKVESRSHDQVSLHFLVSDTGIGIPADKLAVIFESFTQAESSTTRRFGGTGLGLSIAGQLVSLMNGKLWVESTPGVGSTFHFTAVAGIEAIPEDATTPILDGLCGLRILVIDDHATNLSILEEMLLSWEMCPTLTPGGAEALEWIIGSSLENRFDLVLTDYMMPGMDGFKTAEAIQNLLGGDAPPVILLSSAGALPEIEDHLERGLIVRRITKPAKPSDLLDAITEIFCNPSRTSSHPSPAILPRPPQVPQMKVLIAEDGRVNQMVAANLLENRGHEVTLVENGREALAMIRRRDFDAVLMDIQMPEMNGHEATAAIRAWEASHGGHLIVIAMTANAMRGDREECLAAGMDDYVAKPFRAAELISTVEKYAPRSADAAVPAIRASADSAKRVFPAFDETEFHQMVGSPELIPVIVDLFVEESRIHLTAAREALKSMDAKAFYPAVHSLRGLIGNFAARRASVLANKLDEFARNERLQEAAEPLESLSCEIDQLQWELRQLVARMVSSPAPPEPTTDPI